MLYVVYKLLPAVPFAFTLVIGTVASLYLSVLFNKLVELPAALLGKKLIHLFFPSDMKVAEHNSLKIPAFKAKVP